MLPVELSCRTSGPVVLTHRQDSQPVPKSGKDTSYPGHSGERAGFSEHGGGGLRSDRLRELGWTGRDWSTGAWWRRVDDGYSVARRDTGIAIEEHGAELLGRITSNLGMYARYSRAECGNESLTQAQLTGDWRISDIRSVAAEVRRIEEGRLGGEAAGLLGAFKYAQQLDPSLDMYGTVQVTLDDDGGRYADNDALIVGGEYRPGVSSALGAEVSTGDRGDAARVTAEYRLEPGHSLYGGYTYSTDRTAYDPLFNPRRQNGWTLSQRWRLSDRVNLFNESQLMDTPSASGLAHTYGMDFYPAQGWNLGFTLQNGELVNRDGGNVERRAVSLSAGRTSPGTDWQSKLEWRRDTGAEQREQWVSTHRLMHQATDSSAWRRGSTTPKPTTGCCPPPVPASPKPTWVSPGVRGTAPAGACSVVTPTCTTSPRSASSAAPTTTSARVSCRWKGSTGTTATGSSRPGWRAAAARSATDAAPAPGPIRRPRSAPARSGTSCTSGGTHWPSTGGSTSTRAAPAGAGWWAWTATSPRISGSARATTSPASATT